MRCMSPLSGVAFLGVVVVTGVSLVVGGPSAAAPAGYRVRDLGTLGGASSAAVAVNTGGYAVGWAETAAGERHAVRWSPAGVIRDLGTLGGRTSAATALDDSGRVVGQAELADGSRHAFLWTPGVGMRDLGTLGGRDSSAADLNASGYVVGKAQRADGIDRAFLWRPGTGIRDLGALTGDESRASAINDSGQVAGWFQSEESYCCARAFRWSPEEGMRDLFTSFTGAAYAYTVYSVDLNEAGQVAGKLGGYAPEGGEDDYLFVWDPDKGLLPVTFTALDLNGHPVDLNDAGQLAGTMHYWDEHGHGYWPERAFRWSAAEGIRDLGSLGSRMSVGLAINNAGEVVGVTPRRDQPDRHAFVWDPERGMRDLGTLGGAVSEAVAISDAGRVVGTAATAAGDSHAVVWDPPEGRVTVRTVAVADTYVNRLAAGTSFGRSSSLASGGTVGYVSYLRFAVPPAPAGRTLVAATLRLRTNSSTFAGSADVHEIRGVTGTWSGSTTWRTRPGLGTSRVGVLVPATSASPFLARLDPAALTPGTAVNLAVTGTGTDSAWFWSRDHACAANRPTLDLVYR